MTGATVPAPDGGRRRRHRRRAARPGGPPTTPPPPVTTEPAIAAHEPEPVAPAAKPARKHRPARDQGAERGLRDLVGAGHSQLGVDGALRARDVNRPSEQDLADAEQDVVIIKRNWKPTGSS
jgi:hypothetical protein